MSNLFDITKDYDAIINEIIENGGELTPELDEKLRINETELSNKLHAYHYIIKQQEANIIVLKEEIARMTDKRKVAENVIDKLKSRIKEAVAKFGSDKPDGKGKIIKYADLNLYTVYQEKLEVVEESVPQSYYRYETTLSYDDWHKAGCPRAKAEINSTQIKDDLKVGKELEFAKLTDDFYVIRK